MKNLLPASFVLAGILALAACADNNGSQASTQSATMSSDSKNMTGSTVTTSSATVQATATNQPPVESSPSYPNIHSNGQGSGI